MTRSVSCERPISSSARARSSTAASRVKVSGDDLGGRGAALDQPRQPVAEHPRLAGPGPREHQGGPARVGDGGALLGGEDVQHRTGHGSPGRRTACAGPLAGPGGGHQAPGRGLMRTGGTAFSGGWPPERSTPPLRRVRLARGAQESAVRCPPWPTSAPSAPWATRAAAGSPRRPGRAALRRHLARGAPPVPGGEPLQRRPPDPARGLLRGGRRADRVVAARRGARRLARAGPDRLDADLRPRRRRARASGARSSAAVGLEPYERRVVRPHERTHAGPREDRLRLTRAVRANLSPVFGLYPDPGQAGLGGDRPRRGRRTPSWPTATAPSTASGASPTRRPTPPWPRRMRDRWILIADGHHRYETALAYREERRAPGGGQRRRPGRAPYDRVLMGLTALEDPGLVVLPTHRVLARWPEGAEARLRGAPGGRHRRPARGPRRRARGRDPPSASCCRTGCAS